MSEPAVVLRLTGPGRPERVEAWVRALGRAPAGDRVLQVTVDDRPEHLASWCEDAGVRLAFDAGPPTPPDVLVVAAADALPTPSSVARLVAEALRSSSALRARTLPCGDVAPAAGESADSAPVSCVAVPAGALADLGPSDTADAVVARLAAHGSDVRRLEDPTVFVDAWPTPAPARADRVDGEPTGGHPTTPATSLDLLMLRAGGTPSEPAQAAPTAPFLTIVTRTQGTRLLLLEEALTCLAGQSSRDFELLLVCHRAPDDARLAVRDLLAEMPRWLRERSRVVDVDRPGRAAPLNDALALARGRYLAVLDDDDTVTAEWVATFAELETTCPGTVLRASALRQDVEPLPGVDDGDVVPRELGPAAPGWPREFDLVDHLWDNASPFMSLAFPRRVFADLGHRFDETLDAMEDWDYLLRAATLVGVTSSARLTSVYRTWTHTEGSRELHDGGVWEGARESVVGKLDALPLVVPPGTMKEVRALHRALHHERAEKFRFAALNEQAAADLRTVNDAVVTLRERVAQLEERLARLRRRREAT